MNADCHVVTETIAATAAAVYAYARDVARMPEWAAGLATGVRRVDGRWITASPMGEVTVDMAEPNAWGVMDHVVTRPDGHATLNAFRVSPVGAHCVVSFVAVRQPGMSDAEFAADIDMVRRDLRTLKSRMETSAP